MPSQPPGNPNARGSAHLPVGEHDLQLTENHVPILAPGMPVLNDPLGCQVQHPPQRIVVGERGLVFCDLPGDGGADEKLDKAEAARRK